MSSSEPSVLGICNSNRHNFSKLPASEIEIVAGHGVKGDAHSGINVQHLSRVRANPNQPNLRQVHLIHAELFDELRGKGFSLRQGDLGENILTQGVDLLALGRGAVLEIGHYVKLEVTGLRNPCAQIDNFMPGLLKQVLHRTSSGLVRKAGIMTVALTDGTIKPGNLIKVRPASGPHIPLERV